MTSRFFSRVTPAVGIALFPLVAAAQLIPESALSRVGFTSYWQARVPLRSGDSVLAAYVLEGTLYVTSRQGEVHVHDAYTGVPVWTRHVADIGRTLRAPSHLVAENGRTAVVITHAAGAVIYDRESGDVLAEVTGLWPSGSAAVGDALMLYVGSSDGHLYAVRWYDPIYRTPIIRWKVLGGGPVTATPLLIDDVLYFTSQSGKVFACTADHRKNLIWSFATEAALDADAAVDAGSVYVAGLDRSLYALDRETGSLRWRFRMPAPLRDAPVLADGVVHQYCSQSGLTALEAESGKPLWAIPEAVALASRSGERACVVLGDKRLAVLESTTGVVIATLPLERDAVVPIHRDGVAFFVIAPDGEAVCFAPRDMPYLRDKDLRRRGPTPTTAPATQPAEAAKPVEESPEKPAEPSPDVNPEDPLRSRSDG